MAQPEQSEQPQQPEQPEHPASPQASAAAVEAAAIEIDEVERPDSTYGDELGNTADADMPIKQEFPNDESEQDRLDFIHHTFCRLLGDRLFTAPINPEGMRILDIGTGTGIWAIQMGDLYPSAQIIGNDLSPIQPKWVPPNVKFFVDDVEQDWVEPEPYDYIHCRYMAASIRNWPKLMRQCYQNLKPGGWVEFQDCNNIPYSEDNSITSDNHVIKMLELLSEACDKVGRPLGPGPFLKGWVEDAGFTNIDHKVFKAPVGTWAKDPRLKEVGAFLALNFIEGVEAFTAVPFIDVLGWSKEEVTVLNAKVRQDAKKRECHLVYDL
ncbi:S-adenosyl-L-methionine-dependent methyltransferase [Thermoascus aurantiacus ATCC 26904]